MMRKTLAALAVAAAVSACGGDVTDLANGSSGGGCTGTFSGAVSGTFTCTTAAAHDNSNNKTGFAISATGSSGYTLSFALDLGSADLSTGTWSQTSSNPAGTTLQNSSDQRAWAQLHNEGSASDQGTYNLNISNSGSVLTASSGKAWTGVHGSYTGTLPAITGTNASGNVNVQISF